MANNIVLKDSQGNDVVFNDVETINLLDTEGNEVVFSVGGVGSNDFSGIIDGTITSINSATIGSATSIRDNAFNGLAITSVDIPSTVTSIGESAFAGNQISNLTLADGVKVIGYNAFANNSITTLTIPASVTTIGESAFAGNPLTEITMVGDTPPYIGLTVFPNTVEKIYVSYNGYLNYIADERWSAYQDKFVRGLAIPSTITVTVNNYLGEFVNGASVTISGNGQTYTGTTNTVGIFSQGDLQPATYTVSVADLEGFKTPDVQEVVVEEGTQNSVIVTYLEKPLTTIYGVKIDLANSDPETSVTYTDSAIGFNKSYMDFTNDTFVYGSWQDKFPFNQIKPCILKNGVVTKYLNPNNYRQDVEGNAVDTGLNCDGDVMIEIPKIYYRLHKDENYQYIQISEQSQEGFCCLAHTYKGVEKDKVYIGAYQSVYAGATKSYRSIKGYEATESVSLNQWRTYAHQKGNGYENFYWNLLVLLQCLYTIQFKNLNSQVALGYGWVDSLEFTYSGKLDTKGLYYGSSAHGPMKFLGIEDLYGSRYQLIDGVYNKETKVTVADVTKTTMSYNATGNGYMSVADISTPADIYYCTEIMGDNNTGFLPKTYGGSESTYYCDQKNMKSNSALVFGGFRYSKGGGGMFYTSMGRSSDNSDVYACSRLTYCG